MKNTVFVFCLIFTLGNLSSFGQTPNYPSISFTWNDGLIETAIPNRAAKQQSVLGLKLAPMEFVRVGFVGLGMRGPGAVERWTHIPGVQIVALCDYEKERADECQVYLKNASMPPASIYYGETGYEFLCQRNDIDLVYIATDWLHHVQVAKCAMQNGKHVAIEVPSALTLKDCWDLVDLSELKQVHCVMLENCCYDYFEMNTLNMAQHDVFGEIIRAQGAYIHDLSRYWDKYWKAGIDDRLGWRLDYNMRHKGDVYPTHGLGPVAQVMNIHRGDRMKFLVAMDTKSVIGKQLVENKTDTICNSFRNGDHTTTLIRTEQGKVIEIQHNVMTPQPYSRLYQVTGTRGFANKYPFEGYALEKSKMDEAGVELSVDNINPHEFVNDEDKQRLLDNYEHPIWRKYSEIAKEVGGHGGMDFIMDSRLVYCLQNGLPVDIDVYDLAEWCCIAELGAISIDHNSAPVAVPDFTRGEWKKLSGYHHAFASPDEEQKALSKANAFTARLKELGAAAWNSSSIKTTSSSFMNASSSYYSLKGNKLDGVSNKEIYIHNGKTFSPQR